MELRCYLGIDSHKMYKFQIDETNFGFETYVNDLHPLGRLLFIFVIDEKQLVLIMDNHQMHLFQFK